MLTGMQVWLWSLNDGRRVAPCQLGMCLNGWHDDKVGRNVPWQDVQFLLESLLIVEEEQVLSDKIRAAWQQDTPAAMATPVTSPLRKRCASLTEGNRVPPAACTRPTVGRSSRPHQVCRLCAGSAR